MTVYPINVAGADRVIGQLYGPELAEELAEDMLLVEVGRFGIDVRWSPPYDSDGRYVVCVYDGTWQNQIGSVESRNPLFVKQFVEAEAVRLAQMGVVTSGSS